jgi:hypothetical protein
MCHGKMKLRGRMDGGRVTESTDQNVQVAAIVLSITSSRHFVGVSSRESRLAGFASALCPSILQSIKSYYIIRQVISSTIRGIEQVEQVAGKVLG